MTTKNFKVKNGIDIGAVTDAIKISGGVLQTKGGNIQVGITGANELDTSSGNLTIDSAGGTVTVDDNLTVNGTLNDGTDNLTSTFAELNLNDGSSAGTIVNSKAVIYGSSGEVNATTLQIGGSSITSTAAEINIIDGDTAATSTTVADADRVVFNDAGTMKQVAVTDLAAYFDDEITAMPNLVTTGALNSGSITSGFGSINNGSSAITTSGTVSAGTLSVSGNATVSGNLSVTGTTTYVDTTNLTVTDPLVILSKGNSGGSDVDAGIMVERGSAGNNAALYWNEGADRFKAVLTTSGHDATAITDSSFATLNIGGLVFGAESVIPTSIKDEDNMASDSATALATQQSIKAYVDTEIGALSSVAITEGNTNVTVADSGTGTVTVTVDGATHSVFAAAGITLSQGEFVGTATAAEYADLAERFHADAEYPRGTVMMMGGANEVTICNHEVCEHIIGVVSDDAQAGFKMNTSAGTDATHPYIALAGRVDVRVQGDIKKGDRLVSSGTPGVARAAQPDEATAFNVIGRALEDNDSNEITVIKAFVVANR